MAAIYAAVSAILFLYFLLKQFSLLPSRSNKKNLPPGPKGLPILGHFHLFGKLPHQDLHRLASIYGPIMHIQLGLVPAVVVSSPAVAELVLKTYDHIFADRPYNEGAKYIIYGSRDVVSGRYGPSWRIMRKICTIELLSQLRINQFRSMRTQELRALVTSLKQTSEMQESVDVSARVSALTAGMISYMVLGRIYEDSDLDDKRFKDLVVETMELIGVFNLADYFPFLGVLDLQGLTRRMKRVGKAFDGFLEKIIADHAKNKTDQEKHAHRDFVDILMAMLQSGEAGFEFDRRNVKALLLDMLLAGMDTSGTAIEWTLSELMRHPKVLKKLQKELEETVGLNHLVEESDLERLPYLDCVIKESLRLHPVAPLLPHESMEDCEINGFHIPKGSRVMVNVWSIGRDPNVWHDPETFSPERFIGSSIDLRGRDFQLIPFGAGRRGCPGLNLGLITLRLVVAQLVHCFHWELPNGMLPKKLDMSEHFGLVTSRANHLMAIPSYRLSIA